MKKSELFALAEKLHMEPLVTSTATRECYGETIAISGYQTGFLLDSEERVPEIDEFMGTDTGFVTIACWRAGSKVYRYELYAPSCWFENEEG